MKSLVLALVMFASVSAETQGPPRRSLPANRRVQRVLLISIDGFHAVDLANYVKMRPASALARLSSRGVTY